MTFEKLNLGSPASGSSMKSSSANPIRRLPFLDLLMRRPVQSLLDCSTQNFIWRYVGLAETQPALTAGQVPS